MTDAIMRYKSGTLAVFLLSLFATGVSNGDQISTTPGRPPAFQSAMPVQGHRPTGLVAVIRNVPGQGINQTTVSNPYITGVALLIRWNEIEQMQDVPDWSALDRLVTDAASAHKWVQFLIAPGFFAPSWALAGVKTDQFRIQYGPNVGQAAALPMPWDPVYLKRWIGFLRKLSQRYASSSTVRIIAVDGPTSVSDENTLPNSPLDLKQWQADGYKPSKYLNAWKRVMTAYAADFPAQYLSISGVGGGLSINEMGKLDPTVRANTLRILTDQAFKSFGGRLVLQWNNLDGTSKPDKQGGLAFISGYIGRVVTGYMMRTSAAGPGMGDPGETAPVKLKNAIDKGVALNGAGRRVDFIEIYEKDILDPEMQPVLEYAASLFNNVQGPTNR